MGSPNLNPQDNYPQDFSFLSQPPPLWYTIPSCSTIQTPTTMTNPRISLSQINVGPVPLKTDPSLPFNSDLVELNCYCNDTIKMCDMVDVYVNSGSRVNSAQASFLANSLSDFLYKIEEVES